jgi:hypothetical protein
MDSGDAAAPVHGEDYITGKAHPVPGFVFTKFLI